MVGHVKQFPKVRQRASLQQQFQRGKRISPRPLSTLLSAPTKTRPSLKQQLPRTKRTGSPTSPSGLLSASVTTRPRRTRARKI